MTTIITYRDPATWKRRQKAMTRISIFADPNIAAREFIHWMNLPLATYIYSVKQGATVHRMHKRVIDGDIMYRITPSHRKFNVQMNDPVFGHPWYLKNVRNGSYSWTRDSLYAKDYSKETALRHKQVLESGADHDWPAFHNHWKEYWEELAAKEVKA